MSHLRPRLFEVHQFTQRSKYALFMKNIAKIRIEIIAKAYNLNIFVHGLSYSFFVEIPAMYIWDDKYYWIVHITFLRFKIIIACNALKSVRPLL